MKPRGRWPRGVGLAALAWAACAHEPPDPRIPYLPDHRDYKAFRAGHPDLLEPNYLPFMAHRKRSGDGGGDLLVLCRWEARDMPLRVHVASPVIPEPLESEYTRKQPESYVAAVREALAMWERELEGLVRFDLVSAPRRARLHLELVAREAPAPEPDLQVLGLTPAAKACRVRSYDPGDERASVVFEVKRAEIYLADRYGLLDPDQVGWIALHEIGHALGMRGHSPIPADLMYEVVRERAEVAELSAQDVNSFVSLYQLPNGTVFGRAPLADAPLRPPPGPPSGPPQLEIAPHVDSGRGFSWRPPAGWLRVETARGVVAVDGVTWDYAASFQVIVERYDSVEDYLARYGPHYLGRGRLVEKARIQVSERPALQAALVRRDDRFELLTFVEAGEGRVIVVVADCPADLAVAYRPWFDATLATLRIWGAEGRDGDPGQR